MAKDPAFLFYPGDWMGGTMIMTRHQKGCYMDLLIAQFNNGPLSLETIKTILGQDQAVWTVLSSKFQQDSNGNFSNVRLATEIEKRRQFSESRRINGSKGGKPKALAKPLAEHTVSRMEDENRNGNRIKNEIREEGTGGRGLVYDAEVEVLTNPIEFERVCMENKKTKEEARELLRNYHLYLTENEKYPKTRKAVFAGFEKWVRNEKKFYGNKQTNGATRDEKRSAIQTELDGRLAKRR